MLMALIAVLLIIMFVPGAGNYEVIQGRTMNIDVTLTNTFGPAPLTISKVVYGTGTGCTITGPASLIPGFDIPWLENAGTVTATMGKYSTTSQKYSVMEGASGTKTISMCVPSGRYDLILKLNGEGGTVIETKTYDMEVA